MSQNNNQKECITKEKEYKKFINFGKLSLSQPSLIVNEDNFIEQIKKDINSKFNNSNEYIISTSFDPTSQKVIPREEKLVFTKFKTIVIITFFGTFSKVSNNKDVLTNIMYSESNEK